MHGNGPMGSQWEKVRMGPAGDWRVPGGGSAPALGFGAVKPTPSALAFPRRFSLFFSPTAAGAGACARLRITAAPEGFADLKRLLRRPAGQGQAEEMLSMGQVKTHARSASI